MRMHGVEATKSAFFCVPIEKQFEIFLKQANFFAEPYICNDCSPFKTFHHISSRLFIALCNRLFNTFLIVRGIIFAFNLILFRAETSTAVFYQNKDDFCSLLSFSLTAQSVLRDALCLLHNDLYLARWLFCASLEVFSYPALHE